ncbi:MAG: beta-ketoacyl-ACP synthase II [Tidjanibacter sp.]|nr:beta-ketoacyl-ACP synthase II [Tidjanibacter sp.]
MKQKRVVITGVGTINPLGHNVEEYFASLEAGVSGAAPITLFDASNYKTKFACEVKGYDSEQYFDRKESKRLDRYLQFAIISADEAMADANFAEGSFDSYRAGVIWGSGIGGIKSLQDEVLDFAKYEGVPRFSPFFILKMIPNMAAGHISIRHNLCGPSYGTVSACSSSTHAIISAVDQIRLGRADVMVTGGSEAGINESGVGGFNAMMALSTRNDSPETASRPYDAGRDGFVIGEGGAALVLEEYEHAVARGAKIYAEIVGCGTSSDAHHVTAPHPEGEGAKVCIEQAIRDAGIAPEDVEYVNTHGTSTPAGDIPELKALAEVFGDHIYDMNISSTKSMTGHLLGGAGAVEALALVLTLQKGIVPPTINVEQLDEAIDSRLNLTLGEAQQREVRYAMSNTFGFGGQNATIIVKRYEE